MPPASCRNSFPYAFSVFVLGVLSSAMYGKKESKPKLQMLTWGAISFSAMGNRYESSTIRQHF